VATTTSIRLLGVGGSCHEHYVAGAHYREGAPEFYAEGLSVRYEGSAQLVALGADEPGRWF
jgi:hypothetical protein